MNEDLSFEYGDGTNSYRACGATLMGEMWLFGGHDKTIRQASKIEGCKMVRQSDMSFDFYQGACNTFLEPNEKVVLCFNYVDSNDSKICHRSVFLAMFQLLN